MAPMKSSRLIGLALVACVLIGCETLGQSAAVLDEALYEIVPTHPVTGRPVPNLINESQEVQQSAERHARLTRKAWPQELHRSTGTRIASPRSSIENAALIGS